MSGVFGSPPIECALSSDGAWASGNLFRSPMALVVEAHDSSRETVAACSYDDKIHLADKLPLSTLSTAETPVADHTTNRSHAEVKAGEAVDADREARQAGISKKWSHPAVIPGVAVRAARSDPDVKCEWYQGAFSPLHLPLPSSCLWGPFGGRGVCEGRGGDKSSLLLP